MSKVLTNNENYTNIANAIRNKNGTNNKYKPNQMANAINNIPQKNEVTWHQCPEAVRNYLAYVAEHPYSVTDWSVSHIADFAPSTPNEAVNTKPIGYTVDGMTFYDNEPLVAEPYATEHTAGTLTALDRLRWYNTYTHNVRDLGGWACDGGTVKYGQLVRGGLPNKIHYAEDKALMVDKNGIRSELQLYGGSDDQYHYEEESLWGIDWYGTDGYIWYTLGRRDLWKYYLGVIFDSVLHSKPVYFHCGAGKDRTGTIAVMLLALLGVSQSDIDADYELTTFATGSGNGITSRTGTDYKNFINALHSYTLANGLTDTLQNHAFSFVLSLGFSADTINAFRAACIDGTPSIITPTAPSYTITNALTNCVTNNNQSSLVEGNTYSAVITANNGYTLDGATVQITMGGTDITASAYNNGAISVSSVTGNLVITISAAEEQIEIINLANPHSSEWKSGYRINSSAQIVAQVNSQVTNLIPVAAGDTIRIKNAGKLNAYTAATFADANATQGTKMEYTHTYDDATGVKTYLVTSASHNYARFAFLTADVVGTVDDIIITRNQPII